MRFHALLPVRDEADILPECLDHLLSWADAVYVADTGSTDGSSAIVQDYARRDARVIPLRTGPVYFSETRLRGWMFHQARSRMRDGDWFLRVDADEFHHVPPPVFVRERMRRHETIAYHQYYDFKLRASDVRAWEKAAEPLADRARPIASRRRWFVPSRYTEPRLCRYRASMRWSPHVSFPFNAGFVAEARLPIRHYPHRDPEQLRRRCVLRAVMMADAGNRANWSHPGEHHWSEAEWRRFVVRDDDPVLQEWRPGDELAEVHDHSHLRRPAVRTVQRLLHTPIVRLVDRLRSGWPADAGPQPIPEDVQQRLAVELRA